MEVSEYQRNLHLHRIWLGLSRERWGRRRKKRGSHLHGAPPARSITTWPDAFKLHGGSRQKIFREIFEQFWHYVQCLSDRMAMGHYTRVTQAVSRMDRSPGPRLRPLRMKLLALEKENER